MEQEGRVGGGAEGNTKVQNEIGKWQLLLNPAGAFWGPTWLSVSLNTCLWIGKRKYYPLAPPFTGQVVVPLGINALDSRLHIQKYRPGHHPS